jgi:hypothetical protein
MAFLEMWETAVSRFQFRTAWDLDEKKQRVFGRQKTGLSVLEY